MEFEVEMLHSEKKSWSLLKKYPLEYIIKFTAKLKIKFSCYFRFC